MNYKYQRQQIFRKKLKVPKQILNAVYNSTIRFNEFIEYQLDDKIPISCIRDSDRKIVEKFGIEKCKELDWELINDFRFQSLRSVLLSIDSQTEDINSVLYELAKDKIPPSFYTPKMKEVFSDRLFDISQPNNENYLIHAFNDGHVSLTEIINNWELFKYKDLSYCLLNDNENANGNIKCPNISLP